MIKDAPSPSTSLIDVVTAIDIGAKKEETSDCKLLDSKVHFIVSDASAP